ncbi:MULTISPECIES: hypothetical protein [unclassified Tatumella]|uniref:hypothetical protein n=1 Tax=unclassified Tatumella TaxID=2649542 RepID=UPI001BB09AAE|nr:MULTISPECIES: hypothetical protein [unclassified Tatumella]MBS0854960.1 hypothetical protein [Tatumella sp. JGM16]MBS0912078.1 hypothetical protein [Tatumella sp. JGM91]
MTKKTKKTKKTNNTNNTNNTNKTKKTTMTNKNILLTLVTIVVFFFGLWGLKVNTSVTKIFAITLAMYGILQAAIEAADFEELKHKDYFVFFAKFIGAVVTCSAVILPHHN